MGHENRRPDLLKKRGDRHGVQSGIEGAGVGCDLAEVLVQRLRLGRELHTWKEVRPDAKSECAEPVLLVGFWCNRHRQGASTGVSPARLVNQVNGEGATQEDVLEALSSIRRGF